MQLFDTGVDGWVPSDESEATKKAQKEFVWGMLKSMGARKGFGRS
jgi:hypothetical protein